MVSEFEVKEYCTLQTAIKQKKLQTSFGAFVPTVVQLSNRFEADLRQMESLWDNIQDEGGEEVFDVLSSSEEIK